MVVHRSRAFKLEDPRSAGLPSPGWHASCTRSQEPWSSNASEWMMMSTAMRRYRMYLHSEVHAFVPLPRCEGREPHFHVPYAFRRVPQLCSRHTNITITIIAIHILLSEQVDKMSKGAESLGQSSDELRIELKKWEQAFRAANGRKAGREDIRKDAAICALWYTTSTMQRADRREQLPNTNNTTSLREGRPSRRQRLERARSQQREEQTIKS